MVNRYQEKITSPLFALRWLKKKLIRDGVTYKEKILSKLKNIQFFAIQLQVIVSILLFFRDWVSHQGRQITVAAVRQAGFHIMNPRSVFLSFLKIVHHMQTFRRRAYKAFRHVEFL